MAPTRDVVIVGGGVNGSSIAFNLARRGLSVTLVEKGSIACGPTGRSCGIIRQHYSHQVTAGMALRALRIFQNFDDTIGGACDFVQTGFVLTAGPEQLATLEANVELQQSVGVDTRLISVDEIRQIEPHASTEGIVAAAYEPESGYADPYATSAAYAQRAEELGAEIMTGTEVGAVLTDGDRVVGVDTDAGRLAAGAAVVAAGPWSPSLMQALGIELPITPCRVQVCLFNKTAQLDLHRVFIDTNLGVYMRPEGDDLMLVGSVRTDEATAGIDDPDHYKQTADFDTVERYTQQLTRRYPVMSTGSYRTGYASLYDVTPDWQPILDRLPGYRNLFCCCGSSGHGFKLAPVVGEMMAELVCDEAQPGDDIELFSFERFAAGLRADGRYPHKILG